ncbi:MAG: cell wall hydrolase [Acetatifactor sp.]
MTKGRKIWAAIIGLILSLSLAAQADITVQADGSLYFDNMRGGVAALMNYESVDTVSRMTATPRVNFLDFDAEDENEDERVKNLVMANVTNSLNVRSEASVEAERVGMLYKDCGGIILDRKDGWTKLQSGNIIGWASDEYLLFGEDAVALANDVGKTIATVDAETVRVREAAGMDARVLGLLPRGEIVEVLESGEETGWACVDYNGQNGYVSTEYIKLDFVIDSGETVEEIKAREDAEREAKRYKNYGQYTTDADTLMLLAALIHCEAGGEPYEGQVAVGAVVMNRVRSAAYPDSIHGVIYASGQFTPAMTGKLDSVYESGNIYPSCIKAAEEALSGVSNVGDLTHFRRNNGREGLVIGNHVFY